MFAMSWNGLSFTAAAEISGGAQAGRAMGLQNTLMRIAGAAAPLALGALAAGVSWQLAFAVMGLAPLAGRRAARPAGGRRGPAPRRAPGAAGRRHRRLARGPAQVHRHRCAA